MYSPSEKKSDDVAYTDPMKMFFTGLRCCCRRYCYCHQPDKDCRFHSAIHRVRASCGGSGQEGKFKCLGILAAF